MVVRIRRRTRASLGQWQTEVLRFTIFSSQPVQLDRRLWDFVTQKIAPTEERTLPNPVTIGLIPDGRVIAQASGLRLDIILQAAVDLPDYASHPKLGKLDDALGKYRGMFERVLGRQKSVRRLAFGSILSQVATSRDEAQKRLLPYLHDLSLRHPEDAHDVLFQINRRRRSKAIKGSDFHVNRLSKWSVQQIVPATVRVGTDSVSMTPHPKVHALRCELDISTPADRKQPLLAGQQKKMMLELFEFASEIALKGDVP